MAEPEIPPANAQLNTQLAATYPPPPPFYKHFTPENIKKINELRAVQGATSEKKSEQSSAHLPARILDLPPELLFLQPPLPPTSGEYKVFGFTYTLKEEIPSLEEKGIVQLHGTQDLGYELTKLTKSLLLNFLELVGIMGTVDIEQADRKITDDIQTHFINIHDLLNRYRPHEERESLILLMEEQVEQAKSETEGIYAMKKKAEAVLDGIKSMDIAGAEPPTKVGSQDVEDTFDAWEELGRQFG